MIPAGQANLPALRLFWSPSEGEAKDAAPSTWWSLLSESNKNSFNTCGTGVQGDTPKRRGFTSGCYQSVALPDPEKAPVVSELIWRIGQEADHSDVPAKSRHAVLHSVVPSSSLPHNIWTINHQNSHMTAASRENFGLLPGDGVLLLLIWAEQRNSGLLSQMLECFCLKTSIRIPLTFLYIFCKDGYFWHTQLID